MKSSAKGGWAHQGQFCLKGRAHRRGKPLGRLHHDIQRDAGLAQRADRILLFQLLQGGMQPVLGGQTDMSAAVQDTVNGGKA